MPRSAFGEAFRSWFTSCEADLAVIKINMMWFIMDLLWFTMDFYYYHVYPLLYHPSILPSRNPPALWALGRSSARTSVAPAALPQPGEERFPKPGRPTGQLGLKRICWRNFEKEGIPKICWKHFFQNQYYVCSQGFAHLGLKGYTSDSNKLGQKSLSHDQRYRFSMCFALWKSLVWQSYLIN